MHRILCTAALMLAIALASLIQLPATNSQDRDFAQIEQKLRPLAAPLPKPGAHDWLANHQEDGQNFAQYVRSKPVRKGATHEKIYLCLIGEFTREQEQVLEATCEYLAAFYQTPVEIKERMKLDAFPADAQRIQPIGGNKQLLSTYVLDRVLKPHRPKDALAYLAFTSCDLWPGDGWNFVFGQASLRERTGVWSIYRNGDPAKEYQTCLRRTLSTASHETGHILGMQHCIAWHCNMNGSNNQAESDRAPGNFCPQCFRKLCWNLQADPDAYLANLIAVCEKHKLEDEVLWYTAARQALAK